MVRSLILFCLLMLAQSVQVYVNGCTCQEVIKQQECEDYYSEEFYCYWNQETQVCDSIKRTCDLIKDQISCIYSKKCGWVDNKCVDFKQCSDYRDRWDQRCNNINISCVLAKDGQCGRDRPSDCESLTLTECQQIAYIESICVLTGDPVKCVTMTSCESGSYNKAQCDKRYSCFWENDKCRDSKCNDIQKEEDCAIIYSFDRSTATLCHWIKDKCVEANQDDYTEENCFTHSAYGMIWKDSKCQYCKAQPNPDPPSPLYNKVLSIIVLLVAIVLI